MIRIQGERVLTSIEGHQDDIKQEQSALWWQTLTDEQVEVMWEEASRKEREFWQIVEESGNWYCK